MRCWRILAQQQPFTKTTPSPVALSHVYTAFDDTHFEIQLVRHLLFLNLHKECGTRRAKSNAAGRAIPGADAFRLAQLLSRRALVISEHAHQRDETEYADTNAFFCEFRAYRSRDRPAASSQCGSEKAANRQWDESLREALCTIGHPQRLFALGK
mmetsp:Transcript_6209/g.14388  ORF Transcript_6209/g.14388 Transcript_6209/m.14388 type:complete len:155 (-) Transcript_6209:14-478(-)